MQLLNILWKLAQCYTEKWQLSMVLIEVIFCCNSTKYVANFVILFPLLLEMTWTLNLLKRFPPHIVTFLVKLVTFDIPILLILCDKV